VATTLATVADVSPKSQRSSKSIIPGIGTRIEALVEGLGFKTQRAMAKELGISKSTLNRYIKTDRCPDPHILLRLAKRGVSVDALLVGDRPQPKLPGRPTTARVASPGRRKKRRRAAR
jgi:transcriptional regulator with XRE-family HTH domain